MRTASGRLLMIISSTTLSVQHAQCPESCNSLLKPPQVFESCLNGLKHWADMCLLPCVRQLGFLWQMLPWTILRTHVQQAWQHSGISWLCRSAAGAPCERGQSCHQACKGPRAEKECRACKGVTKQDQAWHRQVPVACCKHEALTLFMVTPLHPVVWNE